MSFLTSRTRSARQGFGQPVPRKEDARLVAGQGTFSDDFSLPGQAYAHVVRSPHAHARIRGDRRARGAGGARGDRRAHRQRAVADGMRADPARPVPTIRTRSRCRAAAGSDIFVAPHPVLPAIRRAFVGEAVAMVIAETAAAAADAAEHVRCTTSRCLR